MTVRQNTCPDTTTPSSRTVKWPLPQKKTGASSLGVSTGSFDGFAKEPYRPFDSLKYARQETRANAGSGDTDLMPGDQVSHSKFGHGMVIEADSKTVTVAFDDAGVKKMAVGIAPLKKV